MSTKLKGWIGFDFDGTLAEYGTFKGHDVLGNPIPEAVAKLKAIRAYGVEVRIFTARVSDPDSRARARVTAAIEDWCLQHLGEKLRVTNVKDYDMWCLYDDRAIAMEKNTGRVLGGEEPFFLKEKVA